LLAILAAETLEVILDGFGQQALKHCPPSMNSFWPSPEGAFNKISELQPKNLAIWLQSVENELKVNWTPVI